MKKTIVIALVTALVVTLVGVGLVANAENLPSSKATAKVSELTLIDWTEEEDWTTILVQSIKTPNKKDLFIDVSLETGLYTRTLVRSKRKAADDEDWDTSTAHAEIQVRVVIDEGTADERDASPTPVVFNMREQTLSTKFMGIFTGECIEVDPVTGNVTLNYTCLEPEELELILETLSANSFGFVIDELTPGVHTVSVQARIATNGEADEGEWEAEALVGKGSVLIEVVRMINQSELLDWLG